MSIEVIRGRLSCASEKADRLLSFHASQMGVDSNLRTSYIAAERVKHERLLQHNADDATNWPNQRTHFEIDRDQIIFNENFTRLARKTQVFIGQSDVIFKSRLMHTMEVVQFVRSVAHKSGLNVDLAEAIAYGHDVGHAPFGHAGEDALDLCLAEYFIRNRLSWDRIPTREDLSGQISDESAVHRDESLWQVVQRFPRLNTPLEGLKRNVGDLIIDRLLERDVLLVIGDRCAFNKPLNWDLNPQDINLLQRQFWIQPEDNRIFMHNTHSLQLLLASGDRSFADLTNQTAYGILAHSWREYETFHLTLPNNEECDLTKEAHDTPEAFLVRVADDICFTNSDINDAKRAGMIKWSDITDAEDRRAIARLAGVEGMPIDIPENSDRLQYLESGFRFGVQPATYDPSLKNVIEAVRDFIGRTIYPKLIPRQKTAKRIIRDLFWFYIGTLEGRRLPTQWRRAIEEIATRKYFEDMDNPRNLDHVRLVVNHIAHMTDDEAIREHTALFSPEQAPWARHFMDFRQD